MNSLQRIESRPGQSQEKRMKTMILISTIMLLGPIVAMFMEFQMIGIHGLISAVCLGCCLINASTCLSWITVSRQVHSFYQGYRILILIVGLTGLVIHWHVDVSVFQPMMIIIAGGLSFWACKSSVKSEKRKMGISKEVLNG